MLLSASMETRAPAEHAEQASTGENRGTKGPKQSEAWNEWSTRAPRGWGLRRHALGPPVPSMDVLGYGPGLNVEIGQIKSNQRKMDL